ncbi:MAG: hypothetical protein J2P17_26800 [Mycobacterium sp.]|nr:hypothetical protein [Mycobacterium sp.]
MKRVRTAAGLTLAAILGISACSHSGDNAGQHHNPPPAIHTAQDVADVLSAHDFGVSEVTKAADQGDLTKLGGVAYDVSIRPTKNATTQFKSGINYFDNHADLESWSALSKAFGGIAVVGDQYAVSLPTNTNGIAAQSAALAPRVADALDGKVVIAKAPSQLGTPKSTNTPTPSQKLTPCGVTGAVCPVEPQSGGYGTYQLTDSFGGILTLTITPQGNPNSHGAALEAAMRQVCGLSGPTVYLDSHIDATHASETDSPPAEFEIVLAGGRQVNLTNDVGGYIIDLGADADDNGNPIPGNRCGDISVDSSRQYDNGLRYGDRAQQVFPSQRADDVWIYPGHTSFPEPVAVYADGEPMSKLR